MFLKLILRLKNFSVTRRHSAFKSSWAQFASITAKISMAFCAHVFKRLKTTYLLRENGQHGEPSENGSSETSKLKV